MASAEAEVSAATDLWVGDQASAAKQARGAATLLAAAGETEHAAFWRYVEAHAFFDRGRPQDMAAEAARDRFALMSHEAAVRLYDVLADRLRHYAALCGDGNAEARGNARTKIEALLPPDGRLGRLLTPTQGKVIGVDDVAGRFPPR